MKQPKIKSLLVVINQGEHLYEVSGNIAEIKNNSSEYEDHIHSIYDVFDDKGNLRARIENAPVIIEYFVEN